MNRQGIYAIAIVLVVGLLAFAGYSLWRQDFVRSEEVVDMPRTGEAASNPLYVLKLALLKDGVKVDARQRLRAFAETIAALPPRCREAFVLSRFEGLANGEIAGRLGISRNMVEKHVMRALLACRATRSRLS